MPTKSPAPASAPASAPAPVPPPPPASAPATPVLWWLPPYRVVLAFGLYVMAFWVLWILSPPKGQAPSDLFKTLATAIVLTAFVNGVVAAVFTAKHGPGGNG